MANPLNARQLGNLWVRAGGARQLAPTMAAIALAESSGRVDALNPRAPDYSVGPWQINYHGSMREPRTRAYGSPELLMRDPLANARAAVDIHGRQGLGAWTTYTSGAYKQHLGGAAPAGMGAAGASVRGGTASPPPRAAPPRSASSAIPALVQALLSDDGDYSGVYQALAQARRPQPAPTRARDAHAPAGPGPSLHGPGPAGRGGIAEAFYDPLGGFDEGSFIGPIGGHSDHVHASFSDPQAALRGIRLAQRLGLSVRENPYTDPVDPVHTDTSYHYRNFPGLYGGRQLGQAIDASGDPAAMARLYRALTSQYR